MGLHKGQTNSGSFKKGVSASPKTQFKKGAIPHNKGIVNKKEFTCVICGKKFKSYNKRKYCSVKCSLKSRKQGFQKGHKDVVPIEKRKISAEKMKGEKNWRWIKDRTKLKKSEHKHIDGQYREWMLNIKKRDEWKCRLLSCDCKGRLEAHHIFNWIDYPELRYVLTNGITLCAFHHPRGREEEKRMIPIFQELLSVSKE